MKQYLLFPVLGEESPSTSNTYNASHTRIVQKKQGIQNNQKPN